MPGESPAAERGVDTWLYHHQHGAKIFRDLVPAERDRLEAQGWMDHPDKAVAFLSRVEKPPSPPQEPDKPEQETEQEGAGQSEAQSDPPAPDEEPTDPGKGRRPWRKGR